MDTADESGANLPQASITGKEFCRSESWRHIAGWFDIGHQIAMKSDKKKSSGSAGGGRPERLEREAAALRANLRRRKQQQQSKKTQDRLEEGPEDKDES